MAADVEGGTSTGCLSKSPVPWVGESCREGGCARVLCLGLSGPGGKGGGVRCCYNGGGRARGAC